MTALIPNADTKPIDLARVLELFTARTEYNGVFVPQMEKLGSPKITTVYELDILVDYLNQREWLFSMGYDASLNFLLLVTEAEKDKVNSGIYTNETNGAHLWKCYIQNT